MTDISDIQGRRQTALHGRRLDWSVFFQTVPKAHGIRIRLATVDPSSSVAMTAEKRLLRIVRSHLKGEPFALRRSFTTGPTIIECVFGSASLADELARQLGAESAEAVAGWSTARCLVADERALRRLLKQGAASPREVKQPDEVAASSKDPVGEARSRLGRMSLEEQAAALFKSMMRAP